MLKNAFAVLRELTRNSAPPDPPAGNGGGPPRKGREKERRGGVRRGRVERNGEGLSPRTKILAIGLRPC